MDNNCIVQTEYGKVRGFLQMSLVDIPYIRFLGIPYAKPPVGNLRFKSPLPPSPWGENILDANEEKSACAGKNNVIKQFVGSDDCLYLNVFTKNLNPKKPCPVMVYIHGGGHCTGSSTLNSYSPDYVLMSDVVLVTINYRLGPLGFLTLQDKSLNVPGNAGLKDQQLAMKFVKDNISNFGGDPNNCTLFGHSSGATCVSLHCLAESSRGLFNRALVMSGSPVATESCILDKDYALKLARNLGFDGHSESDALEYLEKADVIAMAEAQFNLNGPCEYVPYTFGPCIEPYGTSTAFMLHEPISLLKSAWSNDIDLMVGGTADEGYITESKFESDPNYESIIPSDLKLKVNDETLKEYATRLKTFYDKLFPTEYEAYKTFNGDQFRWMAMQRFVHSRQNSSGKGRTFFYRFAVDSPTQNHYRNRWFGLGSKGVVHADELSYLWKNIQGDVPSRDSIEFLSIMRFVNLITSFATTGDPNSNVLNLDFNSFNWKPVETPPYKGLNIGETLEFNILGESKRLELLEALYKESAIRLF
nr:carboxylesterase [Bradysia odoriphaga]